MLTGKICQVCDANDEYTLGRNKEESDFYIARLRGRVCGNNIRGRRLVLSTWNWGALEKLLPAVIPLTLLVEG